MVVIAIKVLKLSDERAPPTLSFSGSIKQRQAILLRIFNSSLLARDSLKTKSFRSVAFGAFLVLNELRETVYQSSNLLLTFTKISERVAHWRQIALISNC